MKYTIQPTHNKMALSPITEDMTTASGIILPEIAQRRPVKGRVVAVGENVHAYQVGDVALFPRYAGHEVEVDQETFIVLSEPELLAKLVPET